jgi:glycosyltransferase involved in cell wall biosynthesis
MDDSVLNFGEHCVSKHVSVILSCYNGEIYIEELLDSLMRQDYPNFNVFVRDDGSSDSTSSIIDRYAVKFPNKIYRSLDLRENIGVTRSFMGLLDYVPRGSYFMFCDQDDVWFDDKISTFMNRMQQVELSSSVPTLVFGDMIVTNSELSILATSFWRYQLLDPNIAADWRRLSMTNVVSGCSSMFNWATVPLLQNAPPLAVLHDHLAAILVSRHGIVASLVTPTMFYRQHKSNAEGARAFGARYLFLRIAYFIKVMIPRYRALCIFLGLPFSFALYLKVKTTFQRLLRI